MDIALVGEWVKQGESLFISEPLEDFLGYLRGRQEVDSLYLVCPHHNDDQREEISCLDVTDAIGKNSKERLLPNVDLVYFGLMGFDISELGREQSLNEELPQFSRLVDKFKKVNSLTRNAKFVNPMEDVLMNCSKQYLIQLRNCLPVIESRPVNSLDELVAYSRDSNQWLAKPLVSERSVGTTFLWDASEEELGELWERYGSLPELNEYSDSPTYRDIMSMQGLIVQPFMPEIYETGETKIGVVGGDVTLGFVNKDRKKEGIISPRTSATIKAYHLNLSDEEIKEIMGCVEGIRTHYSSAPYMRLDFIGGRIGEIEIINPSFHTCASFHSRDEELRHYDAMFSAFKHALDSKGGYAA